MTIWKYRAGALGLALMLLAPTAHTQSVASPTKVVVASKPFGESFILAEMFAQLLEADGIPVDRKPGLGSTEILFQALRTNGIDIYPEYTGTGLLAILHDTLPPAELKDARRVFAHVNREFGAKWGMRWLPSIGFQNTFALAVRRETAARYKLATLSDLARESSHLSAGFTADFIERADGLPGLSEAYKPGLRFSTVTPLLPALKYQALDSGSIDVVDGFSTDGLLSRYGFVTLNDDRRFFPPYEASALLGARVAGRDDVVAALSRLSGRVDETAMRALNRRVEVDREDARQVAASALQDLGLGRHGSEAVNASAQKAGAQSFGEYLWLRRSTLVGLTAHHLMLAALALGAAIVVALPLGVGLERARNVAGPLLSALGMLQTIPSIALLAFMVPVLGIGTVPALVALWIYALYPIARGAYTGVRDADPAAVEAAEAIGMTAAQRLLWVRVPLAAPAVMAGIRTAAVITVGATTLGAFIGAGGLGEPIITGLALADTWMVLSGALPAAILALLVDGALGVVERWVAPAHRRKRPHRVEISA
jgi:osmoprotectant transport system permease protein